MHRTELRPLMGDVDAMNVVYYGNYLRFFEKGRAEFMRSTGRPYQDMAAEGLHLAVTSVGAKYRRPAVYDDLLVIETRLTWLKKASLRFDYRIIKANGQGTEEELVTGFTEHGCVDTRGRVRRLPDWVGEILSRYLES